MKNNIKLSLIIVAALSILSSTCLAAFALINPLNIQNINLSPLILTLSLINSWLIIAIFISLSNSLSYIKKSLDNMFKPIETKIYNLSDESDINSFLNIIEDIKKVPNISNLTQTNLAELSLEQLNSEMNSAVEKNDFEKAAIIRDIISKKSSENI